MLKSKLPFFTDLFATGLYLGKIPFMPGTFGSLLAIPLGYFAIYLTTLGKAVLFFIVFGAGLFFTDRYIKATGKDDPSEVVIDEVAALLLIYLIFPFKIWYVVLGFLFFRVYDILKPFPVSYFDSIHNSLGIMLDDIMAAVYAIFTVLIITVFVEAFR